METAAARTAAASPNIKGFAIRGLLKYVKESDYAGGIPRFLESLSEEERAYFASPVLSSSWVPYAAFTGLLRAVDRELGDGDLTSLHRVGVFSGTQDAGTIFKIVLTLTSIERVIAVAPPFWKRYCDCGRFEPAEVSPGRMRIRLVEFPEIAPGHCQLISGWIEGLGRTAGAGDPRVEHPVCVRDGGSHCEFTAVWR